MSSKPTAHPTGAKGRRRPPMRYAINMDHFGADARALLEPAFVQCGADRETQEWLRSVSKPSKVKAVLSDYLTAKWMCRTSANGLLGRGTMFVLSTAQAAALLFGAVQETLASDIHPSLLSRAVDSTTLDMTTTALKVAASPLETGVSLTTPPNPGMATMSPGSPTPDEVANGLCCGTIRGRSGGASHGAPQPVAAMSTSACVAPLAPAEAYRNAFGSLLDIGAGDGGVTSRIAPFCRHTAATEASYPMQWRLWQRGYEVLSIEESEKRKYDVISFLNVLDRCDRPFTLLRQLRERLNQGAPTAPPTGASGAACGGKLLIAVVLPWCPFVEEGTRKLAPTETLNMDGGRCADKAPFETCVEKLVMNVFRPAGYRVVRWTRVPYLCEGNTTHEYFVLDDAVFVLESDSRATPVSVAEATAGSVGKNCVK